MSGHFGEEENFASQLEYEARVVKLMAWSLGRLRNKLISKADGMLQKSDIRILYISFRVEIHTN